MINFCIFEDDHYVNLTPLTDMSPIFSTLVGQNSIFEKFANQFNYGNITINARAYLKPYLKKRYYEFSINNINTGAPCLFFNGRVLLNDSLVNYINSIDEHNNTLLTYKNTVIATFLKGDMLNEIVPLMKSPPSNQTLIKQLRPNCITIECEDIDVIEFPWDIIRLNQKYIEHDFKQANQLGIIKGQLKPFTVLYNENNVFIDTGTNIEDFVTINAEKGPVYIEKNVTIQAHTRLEGPLFIGKNTHILGGKIKGSSIGQYCKVSGEISSSIIQAYSNKAHEGFLGNSYIGEWVNLGAGTTTSNLKNTYSTISSFQNSKNIDTKEQFLGSIIGNFTKIAIGTLLNSGSIIHCFSTLFNHDVNDTFYPMFSWGPPKKKQIYDIDKFIKTTQTMMQRRQCLLSDQEIELFHYLFNEKIINEQK